MRRIVWLASYPKAGNTWVRVLLTNYRRDADAPADINRLDGGPIASARVWFDEWVGVEASLLPAHVVDRLRPEVYRCLARVADEPLFMKVHDAWRLVDTGEPMFPADVTAGVVYIIRNPLDMVMSVANHYGISAEGAVERLCDSRGVTRNTVVSLHDQLRQRLGSWSEHVRSWVDESGLRVHVVRYEDLRVDTVAAFAGIVRFCGLDRESDDSGVGRVAKAVAFSAFAELSRQESETRFRERPPDADRFFRKGQVGAWRSELAEPLVRRLLDTHRATMERFGYSDGLEVMGDAS
jgi:hypothetical protein